VLGAVLGRGVVGVVSSPLRPYISGAREVFTGRKLAIVWLSCRSGWVLMTEEAGGSSSRAARWRDSGIRRSSRGRDIRGRGLEGR
jgi:hypothetical protein